MCVNPIHIKRTGLNVRCGKCYACRDFTHRSWSVRLQIEMESSLTGYFVTLTFDSDHYHSQPTIEWVKREITLFLKNLRDFYKRPISEYQKRFLVTENAPEEVNFKYYLVAERGEKNNRYHYHMLLFNLPFGLECVQTELEKVWSKGRVHIGSVTPSSISYTVDYMLKNDKGDIYKAMSKGLGNSYLTEEKIKYHQQSLNPAIRTNYGLYPMPRYISSRIFNTNQKKKIYESFLFKRTESDFKDIPNRYNYIANKVKHNNLQK